MSTITNADNNQLPYKGLLVSNHALYLLAKEATKNIESPKKMFAKEQSGHHHAINPSSIKKIREAELIVWLGKEIEAPLAKVILKTKNKENWAVLSVKQLYPLKQRSLNRNSKPAHTINPHIWLDPIRAQGIVAGIAAARARQYPIHAKKYKQNAAEFSKKMIALAKQSSDKKIKYVTEHDAYHYMEKINNLTFLASYKYEPEDALKLSQIKYVENKMKTEKHICVISADKYEKERIEKIFSKSKKEKDMKTIIINPQMVNHENYYSAYNDIQKKLSECH